jgi:NAD(P)-dependent dehydrogenase (short-subunit alcohol dehydrogenase family)
MSRSSGGRVVVVTGASAGVGRASVRAFAEQGARLGLLARGRDGLEAARREVEELGGEALVLPTDVADSAQVEAAAAAVEERFGPIEVWVNCAMATVFSPFLHTTDEEFARVTDVCYLGYVHGSRAALRRMVPRNRGVIVQVGSALAYRAIPLQSAYCGAKHAIRGFTDSLRCELLHEGSDVHLTAVHLPGLNTPQFRWSKSRMPLKARPVAPIFQPEVAAEAVVWAADHHPREISVGLNTAVIIAGNKLAPGLGDRYLARTAVDGQLASEPEDPERPDNLWQPLPGDHGARGVFDDEAKSSSVQLEARKGARWLGLAGLAGAAGAAVLLALRGNGAHDEDSDADTVGWADAAHAPAPAAPHDRPSSVPAPHRAPR